MKKILWSILGCTLAGGMLLISKSNTFSTPNPLAETISPSLRTELSAASQLRMQVAHLRTIDPFDIDIIPASRPVPDRYPLGSVFGMRRHPILGVDKMHAGIDFPAPLGTPVLATATGKVSKLVESEENSSYGTHILLVHDEIYCTLYAHLSQTAVSIDEIVEEGDTIGYVGSTGRSTNPHLHYEVIRDGIRVNPNRYF
jgi:murein DD-endopeptidase MepM/ murein hydrolase activator NlpD